MRTKKYFSFDEETLSEDIITEGFDETIDYGKMYLVAKYFRQKFNYGEKRLEREVIDFCMKQDPLFNPILEMNAIRRWVNSALKYNLRKIETVSISLKDIEFLKTIPLDKDRKILFSILVLSKALKNSSTRRKKKDTGNTTPNFYIRYNNIADIIALSGISGLTENRVLKTINKYKEYFFFYFPEKRLIRVDFIDKSPEKEYEIKNMEDIEKEYESIFGKNVSTCSECGRPYSRKSNNQKLCPECYIDYRNNYQKELMRKKRVGE